MLQEKEGHVRHAAKLFKVICKLFTWKKDWSKIKIHGKNIKNSLPMVARKRILHKDDDDDDDDYNICRGFSVGEGRGKNSPSPSVKKMK